MDMSEALEWAADYTKRAGIFEPIKNERGFADNWKPPTPREKADIILLFATKAMEGERPSVKRIPTRGPGSQVQDEDDDHPF